MKRLQTIFITLLAIGSLPTSVTGMTPPAAPLKELQTSGSGVTQQQGQAAVVSASPKEIKVMREYRGIKLGMKRDEVRDALGKPELSDQGKDRFKLGGDDLLTAHYDGDNVKVIQLYFFESKKAPDWADVVGETEIEQRSDGSKVARREIPEEKFWVSMYRSKSGAITTVTISRSGN